jgi:hypothetical protein
MKMAVLNPDSDVYNENMKENPDMRHPDEISVWRNVLKPGCK